MVLVSAGGLLAYPDFLYLPGAALVRSQGLLQPLAAALADPSPLIPYWTIFASSLYTLGGIFFIYIFFGRTQSPEIIFIAFFIMSFSLECARLAGPLREVLEFPALYLRIAPRVLLFGRYFGIFSLFGASVFAAAFDVQKQLNIFFMAILASLVITLNVPMDGLSWDTALTPLKGYSSMLIMVEGGIIAAMILTFFISAYIQSSRNYIYIGLGSILMLIGRNILLSSDTLLSPIPGFLILAGGTWFTCAWLHKIYLWR